MTLIILFFVGPVAAFLFVVAVPRRLGFALALLIASVASVGVLRPPTIMAPFEAAVSKDLTLFAALLWIGAVAVGSLLQAARPALRARGWAAYPLTMVAMVLVLLGLTL